MNILEILTKYEARSYHHEVPVVWERAKGWSVWDEDGNEYIDFTSGIFVANIGHSHSSVVRAIQNQSGKMLHNYAFPTEIRAKLIQKLIEMTGMEKVFLCSTGSEAVEVALRCMRHFSKRQTITSLDGCFHGHTFGARRLQHSGESCNLIDYDTIPSDVWFARGGIIFESYFGWSAQFHPIEWVQKWCNWAQKHHIPVCFDEVQAGFGRTGKMFGYQHYDIQPDLIVVGKALGGGLPISAVIGRADLLDAPDDLSSTHSGNPICCAAALATLEVLEAENLVEHAKKIGEWLEPIFKQEFPQYTIRGKGMIWAIDIGDVELTKKIVECCTGKGLLLVQTGRGTIKIGPPLITPKQVIRAGLFIIKEAINECQKSDTLE